MSDAIANLATAFDGERRLAAGPLIDVAMAIKAALAAGAEGPLLAFDDATGQVIDFDLRGSRAEIAARLVVQAGQTPPAPQGRPAQSRRRRPRGDAATPPLGMARRTAERRFGDVEAAG